MRDTPLPAAMMCGEEGVLDDLPQRQNATGDKLMEASLVADFIGQFSSTNIDLSLAGIDHLKDRA